VGILEFFKKFFKNPNAVLLIEGRPGSGKTILSLTISKILRRKAIYISTRGNPMDVLEQIPIAKKVLSKEDLVDARGSLYNDSDLKTIRSPDGISLIEQLRTLRKQNPDAIFIIDSIQAFERVLTKSNMHVSEIHQLIKGNWIYISEKEDEFNIERDVSGVIKLGFKIINQRRFRVYEITKSRGVPIERPFGVYTLVDGIFRTIPIPEPQDIRQIELIKYEEPVTIIPTGIKKVDSILGGGLKLGSSLHVILPYNLNTEYASDLFGTLLLSWIDNNKKLIVLLPCNERTEHIKAILRKKYTDDKINDTVIIINPYNFVEKQGASYDIRTKIDDIIIHQKEVLIAIFIDTFLTFMSIDEILNLMNKMFTKSNITLLLFSFQESKINQYIMTISDLSIRLSVILGSLIAYIEKPYHINPFFVFKARRNKKSRYDLVEII